MKQTLKFKNALKVKVLMEEQIPLATLGGEGYTPLIPLDLSLENSAIDKRNKCN